MIGRRALLAGGATLALTRTVRAGTTMRLLVGAPEGVGTDLEARAFAPFLERHLPHAGIEVVNLPGEAGLTAYRALGRAGADTLTVGWVASPSLAARMVDRDDLGLLNRLTLLGAVQEEPLVLVVPASGTLDSVSAIVQAAADSRAMPFGTPSAGSPPHLGALHLQAMAGTSLNIVPFPSVAAVRQAAVDGNVAAAMLALGDAVAALRDGRLVGIGIAAAQRIDALPDLPTLTEAGTGLVSTILRGLAVPASLPVPLQGDIKAGLQAVVADPEYKAQGDSSGFSLLWLDGPDWLTRLDANRTELRSLWQDSPWLPAKGG